MGPGRTDGRRLAGEPKDRYPDREFDLTLNDDYEPTVTAAETSVA
jgi:hypothetical protein